MHTKIVTPNVIRQALNWMGAPNPIHIDEYSKPLTSPQETSLQQVWVEFNTCDLLNWLTNGYDWVYDPQNNTIATALQECFCGDIQVMTVKFSPLANRVKVSLLLVVANDPAQ